MTPAKKRTGNVLYVGVDLGTSRSAVVSSSGKKEWVQSYVGWPRDFVAKKMLGKSILFGEDALDNRLSLTLVRPLEQGVIRTGTKRDEEAVRELIHHLIEMACPDEGQEIYAAIGVPAEALRVNKLAIRKAVKEYTDRLMVVSEPFAVAYGMGMLSNTLIIDIGAGTVDLCIMHGTMPGEGDQRTLTTAGDYVDRQLLARLEEGYPSASLSLTMVRGFKESNSFVGLPRSRVNVKVPVAGVMTSLDITDEMGTACMAIVEPIAEATMDLISGYEPDFQELLKLNVYLAGGGSQIRGLDVALKDTLKRFGTFKVHRVRDPLFAGADGALSLARDMPDEYWEDV